MTTPASFLRRVLLSGFATLYSLGMAHSAPIPPTDNTDAPYMGVYEWGFAIKSNLDRIGVAADWWSRRQLWGQEFAPTDSWDSLQAPDWLLAPAAGWVRQDPSRYYILSIGMLPGPWDGSGPATGLGAGVPVSLAAGATGAYNGYFQTLAQNLVRNGLADNTIIRLGWEFNGTWYAWRADTGAKALDYARYWQQIVTAMRAVPGAANLKFCWNGAIGWTSYPLADAYPGDAYVDIVGVDCYDQSWAANSYPYPANASAAHAADFLTLELEKLPGVRVQARGQKADVGAQSYYAFMMTFDPAAWGGAKAAQILHVASIENLPGALTFGAVYKHPLWNTSRSRYRIGVGNEGSCPRTEDEVHPHTGGVSFTCFWIVMLAPSANAHALLCDLEAMPVKKFPKGMPRTWSAV